MDPEDPRSIGELALEQERRSPYRRRSPRARITLPCTLRRSHGSPVTGQTHDVGPGGMCASTSRPLIIDERLDFDLALDGDDRLEGRARVLREQRLGVYAFRFESVSDEVRARLQAMTR
jgi:hypothetical protein